MPLTNENLVLERPHLDGVQRIYRFASGKGLSVVNGPMLHTYPFAWEAAVLAEVTEVGRYSNIDYSTPLTDDVVVFASDDEANEFIAKAAHILGG